MMVADKLRALIATRPIAPTQEELERWWGSSQRPAPENYYAPARAVKETAEFLSAAEKSGV